MKKILVVDDEGLFLKIFTTKLGRHNYEIITAENGEEGYKKALSEHPDLVLTDLYMPGLDGLEMVKKLRGDDWGKSVPVMVVTNMNISDLEEDGEKYVISGFYSKSMTDLSVLVEKIDEILT